ncbi:MAG: envelope stress response membrane protein PspB [Minwuiales bacterium]|nr:envelope stress response membrane protein PspB [Minwuiales bacterium]
MGFFLFVPAVIFLTVVAPIWIIAHYVTRWRTGKALSSDEERLIAELWQTTDKMEQRIVTLERILDAEAPNWRRPE